MHFINKFRVEAPFSLQIKSLHYFCYVAMAIFSEQISKWSNKMQNEKRSSSMKLSFSLSPQSWSIHYTSNGSLQRQILLTRFMNLNLQKICFLRTNSFIEIPQAFCRMYESGSLNPPASWQHKSVFGFLDALASHRPRWVSEYMSTFEMQITFEK